MIANKMKTLVNNSSIIRAMFDEGQRLSNIYGEENVFDFSLGNPNVEPPEEIKNSIIEIISSEEPNLVHGYMNNSGYDDVREEIANYISVKNEFKITKESIVMTCGAAGGLNIILKTLLNPEEEVIVFAPFFGEYSNYVSNFDGKLNIIPADTKNFEPNFHELENRITKNTKAVIINTPNNPTGVVYSEETIKNLSNILEKKQKELGISIYLISDEPYKEIVYDEVNVPFILK